MYPLIHVYPPDQQVPPDVVLPDQVHGTRIVEIITGRENLTACDGVWTASPDISLGVRTADCAPVCLWDDERIGIVHAGWRGLVDGIIENALALFQNPQVWIGPLYPQFEIQPDACAEQIEQRFGTSFFSEKDRVLFFNFHAAIASIVPSAEFDPRSTYDTPTLASWRRNRTSARNTTVISF